MEPEEIDLSELNDSDGTSENKDFEKFVQKNRVSIILLLVGIIFVGLGVLYAKDKQSLAEPKIEILESASESQNTGNRVVVEVSGAVEKPGVYEFEVDDRIEDALIAAGGVSADADRDWMEKILNRAAKLTDGQKIYIPSENEQTSAESANYSGGDQTVSSVFGSQSQAVININTASQKELESLWGIGPVYATNIIEHRPYSSVEELLTKKIIKSNVYERNKDLMTAY